MRWCCFLFWSAYRFTLALLAHFNWFTSIYVNCVYFVLWKSYDLLWFWMHLILCICFKPLRARNYLIVWCNLIRKRITNYPNSTYKEIYMLEYRKLQKSRRKRKSDRINKAETFDGERREADSSDDNQDVDAEIGRDEPKEVSSQNLKTNNVRSLATAGRNDDGHECMEQMFMSGAISLSANSLRQCDHTYTEAPIPSPVLKKQTTKSHEEQDRGVCSHVPVHERWNRSNIRDMILKPLKSCKQCKYCAPRGTKRHSSDVVEKENIGAGNVSDSGSQIGLTDRMRRYLPLFQRRDPSFIEDSIDILTPDFTNKRDLTSWKEITLRQKRDQKLLKKRLQAQKRAELAIIAKHEAKQKMISSSIQLLLQILQMMASFAILVGNIRKTFIPAHFNWRKHDHNDSARLMILWRCTVFLDVLLFWTGVIWTYCLQCHLCCRLGLLKFFIWVSMLGLIGGILVWYPMSHVQDNLDVSWCQFKPNSTLAHYQPSW